jgi:hypothetical protein
MNNTQTTELINFNNNPLESLNINPLEKLDFNYIKDLQKKSANNFILKQANDIYNIIKKNININPIKNYVDTDILIYKENLVLLEHNNICVFYCIHKNTNLPINKYDREFYIISWNFDHEKSITHYKKYNKINDKEFVYEKYAIKDNIIID